jgi:OmpA-OmpF porin, OOP family
MLHTKKYINLGLLIVFICITTISVNAGGQNQVKADEQIDVKTLLFNDANAAMQASLKVNADVLAPDNYSKAMKHYQEADADLKKGKKLEDIKEKLGESIIFFHKAIEATKLAEVTFPNSMKARMDAQTTGSAKYSSKLWKEAEEKFNDAAGELEDGDVNAARKKAGEAEEIYRKAELDAIKANYLDETRELLKRAEELDVKDRAPKTLLNAQHLVSQAEKELNENRYDTDVARSLARQANYQAKHALYLANTIEQMKDKDQSWEDLMLAAEIPLRKIAETTRQTVSFDKGFGTTTYKIIAYIKTYQDSVFGQSQDLDMYKQNANLLGARIAEMEQQFGSQAKEKSVLAQQIASQAKTRQQFTNVERSFNYDEARVLREGDDVIIRLVGLNFPVAAATIEQKSFALLTKVRNAINSFPGSTVSVKGFTDSHGSDVKNLQLSRERADAVRQYLLADTMLNTSQIEASGYGESKPIGSNETTEGRAANRRVEIVIHPSLYKISQVIN